MHSRTNDGLSISGLCLKVGYSRQAYYKAQKKRQSKVVKADLIVNLVCLVRQRHPKMGTRKLRIYLKKKFNKANVKIGRDRMFKLLKKEKLLIPRKKCFKITTDSNHPFRIYKDLLKAGAKATKPNEIYVSDITYIHSEEGFMYLALITDAYSRKIIGYDISDSLEAEGCIRALKMAQRQLPKGKNAIHHSDRGFQYCCKAYINQLKKKKQKISMTQDGNCYDNAMAERMNGILKTEYMLGLKFKTKSQAKTACVQAIKLYNEERPHYALGMETPNVVHAA